MPESLETRRNEALFGAFFDRATTPLLIIDDAMRIVGTNAVADEMLGLTSDDDADLLSGFWSVSATAVMRLVEGARREIPVGPVSARTAGDQLVDVDAFLIEATDPQLLGVVITDRAQIDDAQSRLKEQEERYRSLFEWAPVAMREEDFTKVGVWLDKLRHKGVTDLREYMDANPKEVRRAIRSIRTSRVNAATVELLKAPSVAAITKGFEDRELTPQVLDAFMSQFETLWEGGSEHIADFVGVNFLDQPFECRLRWTVPRSGRGLDLSRVAVSLLDLTQLRATERRLERLVADKDRFIASVSHELRTPLAAVFGLSEELTANWERFDETEQHDLVGLVAAQSAELTSIVEDLLVAANLEEGRITINATTVDLNAVVAESLADCQRSAPRMRAPAVSGPAVNATADLVRVRQIVRNLIVNAARYGGAEILIKIGDEDRPFIEVSDDGEGIPLEHREAIFVPYFQASAGEKVLGSLGLGLAISRELARHMGGELSYTYRDNKSIFRLDLPPA